MFVLRSDLSQALNSAELGSLPLIEEFCSSSWRRDFVDFVDSFDIAPLTCALSGVVGFPADQPLRLHAELYGKITGRRVVAVSGDPCHWPDNLAVLLTLTAQVNSACLRRLVEASELGRPIGLLTGRDESAVYKAAIGAAASLSIRSGAAPLFVDILGETSFELVRHGNRLVAGGRLDKADAETILAASADVLRIRGHSDGFDASLPSSILCSFATREGVWAATDDMDYRLPACAEASHCFRTELPMPIVGKSQRLTSVDGIRARLLVLDMCQSIMPSDLPFDSRLSLFCRMAESPTVLSIIATPDYSISGDFSMDSLLAAIADGASLYEAVGEFCSAAPERTDVASRFIVLGDPAAIPFKCSSVDFTPIDTVFKLDNDSPHGQGPTTPPAAQDKAGCIARAFWHRTIEESINTAGPPFRTETNLLCSHCGGASRRITQANDRVTLMCLRCGPTYHGLAKRPPPRVKLEGSRIVVDGLTVGPEWHGLVVCWGYGEDHLRMADWPRLPGGAPVRDCQLPTAGNPPMRRAGIVFVDEDWQLFSIPAKAGRA